jgi:thiamine-phosphate pyrophosphorylase
LRVIDAAANRASEGLRVIEDYVRFALDDRHLTTLCKQARHDLTSALASIRASDRHAARDTRADVGTQVSLATEQARASLADVVAANFKRVEQALRSLEEFCKVVAPASAPQMERLRYVVYTLERATDITQSSLERLAGVRLYVLVDGGASPDDLRALVESLVEAGVGAIQLRDKQLDDRRLLQRARIVRAATSGTPTLFIMNDRPDLAVLCGADGVHIGQDELSVKDARRILGVRGLIGVSTHTLDQARAAVLDGANYLGVGPTFPSTTKTFESFTGVELLNAVHSEIRLPAFAIGGITLDNVPQVLATGIGRVAVSGAITSAADAAAATRAMLDTLSS